MYEEYLYELKIPKERIAVLIGKSGEEKRQIEIITETNIEVNSKEGEVTIRGKDAINLYTSKEIVRAIGRGFNPEIARLLVNQDYGFELLIINGKTSSDFVRLRGRVIGEGGKSRKTIEELTETNICVYGKSIGIIGPSKNIPAARKAVEMLLKGSPHPHVYGMLQKRRRKR